MGSTENPDAVIVLTTLGAKADAAKFARSLVEERLAACVNILPAITSVYRWQDQIEEAREQLLIIKTTRHVLDALRVRLHALHSYEVPEFLVLGVADGSDAYLRWLGESTGASR